MAIEALILRSENGTPLPEMSLANELKLSSPAFGRGPLIIARRPTTLTCFPQDTTSLGLRPLLHEREGCGLHPKARVLLA
jgi:hypothetical protein